MKGGGWLSRVPAQSWALMAEPHHCITVPQFCITSAVREIAYVDSLTC